MRKPNSSNDKNSGMIYLVIGYGLLVIVLYLFYRAGAFFIAQINIPADFENLGIVAFAITITLLGTNILLRYDKKPIRRPIAISKKEY